MNVLTGATFALLVLSGCAGVQGAILPEDVGETRISWGANRLTGESVTQQGKELPFGLALGLAPAAIYGLAGDGATGVGYGLAVHVDATVFAIKHWGIGLSGGGESLGLLGAVRPVSVLAPFAGGLVSYQIANGWDVRGGANYLWSNVGRFDASGNNRAGGWTSGLQGFVGADLLLTRSSTREWALRFTLSYTQTGTAALLDERGRPTGESAGLAAPGAGLEVLAWW